MSNTTQQNQNLLEVEYFIQGDICAWIPAQIIDVTHSQNGQVLFKITLNGSEHL